MQCHLRLLIILLATTWTGCSCSQFNASLFAEAPPLYALEEWSKCTHPEDVYCMVDAALISSSPSPVLDFLKEYSSNTLKHYNRTLVHRGVCITRCGGHGPETWPDAAQSCINKSLVEYGLEAQVLSVQWCNRHNTKISTSAYALNIVFLSLLGVTLLATGLHVLGPRCGALSEIRYILAFSIKHNWQALIRIRSPKKTGDRTSALNCFEGVRFLGTLAVVFTHVSIVYVYSYIDNPEFIENLFDHVSTQVAFNTPIWMQAFFSISGFLLTYYALIYTEKESLTFGKCLLSIIQRWIRLTPVALFALWFTIAMSEFGTGPQWSLMISREAHDCSERWWYHVLYIHNYLPLGKYCMGHTWYLAVDMQLHVIGMILLLIFLKWRKLVAPVLLVLLASSIIATGLVAYFYDLTPIITAQTPEIVSNMFKGSHLMQMLYLPVWMNLSGYLFGFITAFIYYDNQVRGVKLNELRWFNILFHTCLLIGGCVTLAGVAFLSDKRPPQWASVVYASFDRFLVALCFNVFVMGCISNCKSIIPDILAWKGFHILGRLSYSVFIFHFIVMRLTLASNTQIGHVSAYSMISLLVVGAVLSYMIAVPIYLIIEMPAIQLYKVLCGGYSKNKESDQQQDASPTKLTRMTNIKQTETNEV